MAKSLFKYQRNAQQRCTCCWTSHLYLLPVSSREAAKNEVASITHIHLVRHEQKHHEQNSWTPNCVNDTLRERERRDVAADPRKQKWIPHLRLAFIAQQLPRELQALTEPKPLFVRTKAQNQMRVCSRLYQFMIVPRSLRDIFMRDCLSWLRLPLFEVVPALRLFRVTITRPVIGQDR